VFVALRRTVARAQSNRLSPALAVLLTVFAIAPLAYPGFFQSYTGYSAVYNLIELQTHPGGFLTWAPTWGRAFDFLRMDGPLGYWLAEIFHLATLSYSSSIQLVYAVSFGVSAYGMFVLARHLLDSDAAGLVAAALYTYFPAHIAAVYVRGAFGEALAWALFPVVLYSVIALEARVRWTWRAALACGAAFAALLLAQPGLAILFALLTRFWVVALVSKPHHGWFRSPSLLAMLAGLAIGIAVQLPAILAQPALASFNGFVPVFVYPFQLFTAAWGSAPPQGTFDPSRPADAQAPYQIGFAALGLTILAVALLLRSNLKAGEPNLARRVTWFACLASVVFLGLMLPFMAPLWQWTGLDLFVQYPFQLLIFVGFLLPFAAGSIVIADAQFAEVPLLAVLVLVPLLAVYPYLAPEFYDLDPSSPALARFNHDEIALLDAKITRPPGVWRHGATVQLDLTWQALRQPNRDYTVFLHILDANGKEWGGTDEKPQGGTLPTLKWTPGRVISDTHSVQIQLAGPPEGYHMELGLYQRTTGERATTETGATEVILEENK
jgi:hypothetical protein